MKQRYLSREDFLARFLPPGIVAGKLTDSQIEEILDGASGDVLSYLRKRYLPPFSSWGSDLENLTGDIARFRALSFVGFRPGSGNNEIVVLQWQAAISKLKDAARGLIELDIVDASEQIDEEGPLFSEATTYDLGRWNTRR